MGLHVTPTLCPVPVIYAPLTLLRDLGTPKLGGFLFFFIKLEYQKKKKKKKN